MISLGQISAQLLCWLLMCPECDFETDVRLIGHTSINYGQKIICDCPNCEKRIVKTVGVNVGLMDGNLKHSPNEKSGSCDNQIR